MHYFAEINDITLSDSILFVFKNFEATIVQLTKISNEKLTSFLDDCKLRVVHLLLIWDLKVIHLSLTYFSNGLPFDDNLLIDKVSCIGCFYLQSQRGSPNLRLLVN